MATTKIAIAPMKAAQIPKPGADFQIVEREISNRVSDKCESRCRPAVSATVTCSRKKASRPEFRSPHSRTRSHGNYR